MIRKYIKKSLNWARSERSRRKPKRNNCMEQEMAIEIQEEQMQSNAI